MLLRVGPVPSESVLAYVKVARSSLEALAGDPRVASTLTPDLLERFEDLHGEWERAASAGGDLCWEREVSLEEAEWLVLGFFRVTEVVAADGGPPAGLGDEVAAFYTPLVVSLLDAIAREGGDCDFAENLRRQWPYLADS